MSACLSNYAFTRVKVNEYIHSFNLELGEGVSYTDKYNLITSLSVQFAFVNKKVDKENLLNISDDGVPGRTSLVWNLE